MASYPDLSKAKCISFDIETYDPNLKDLGPGDRRGDGKILGVSLSDGKFSEYYDVGHYNTKAEDAKKSRAYIKEVLSSSVPKLGARIQYDIGWLESAGIPVNGQLNDIQIAEALIDENQAHYNLDFLAEKYLGLHKEKSEIETFCEANNLKGDARNHLHRMPHQVVRRYAMADVALPFKVFFDYQFDDLVSQNLTTVYNLECELQRVLLQMRKVGVMIDTNLRDRNAFRLQNIIEEMTINLSGT